MFTFPIPYSDPLSVLEMPPGILPYHGKTLYKEPMLETPRLILRRWESRDVTPFVMLCRDPEVMRFFNGIMSPIDCFEQIERQENCFDHYGYGLWAVELKATGEFIGSVGIEPTMLKPKGMTARMAWKLCPEFWGYNYAYEAGKAVTSYAFQQLKVKEIIALVDQSNVRSIRLVQRLGLNWNTKDRKFLVKRAA